VLAIGDVAGHGVRAAAAMGRVSHALRAYAGEGHGPAALLRRLDGLVASAGIDMVTCLLVLLDPATGVLRCASAGHPPALVVRPGEPARRLECPPGHPLGVVAASRYEDAAGQLDDAESLVLYTDGLVERRGEVIDAGIDALAAALDGGAPDTACDGVLARLLDDAPPRDDVALLVARRVRLAAPRAALVVPAEPQRLRQVRRWVEAWLRGNDVAGRRAGDVLLAVHEAAMNAVEHAYGPVAGTVEVRLARAGAHVEAEVRDTGRWRETRGRHGDRGRGLPLMRTLVDEVAVERGETGTIVRMRTQS
jgi:anti-sigma regulatory factor (Ser/Thr protein kinase)